MNLSHIMERVFEAAINQAAIEWLAFGFSIVYVILAARQNIWCWLFGFISVLFYFFVFVGVDLFSDASLQVFYMGMSVYGFVTWRKGGENGTQRPVTFLPVSWHVRLILGGLVLAVALGYFWTFFGASLPYIDALTTAFSIIATFLAARKILENWLYWIIIDFACIGIYVYKEIYLTALLFLIYGIIAIAGWRAWKQDLLV